MIETMDISEKDYLQVFRLSQANEEGIINQRIVHTQEQPHNQKEFIIETQQAVTAQIFVIGDETHCTMLLANGY